MSNMIFASFGNQLIRNALRQRISPLIVNKLLDKNTNKCSLVVLNRCINTTGKKKDSIESFTPGLMDGQPRGPQTVKEFADVESQKNWVTYGYDIGNMENDRYLYRLSFFLFVTVGFIMLPYIVMYYPDYNLHDWTVREAYLELDRRERLGLPLIDKNVVDPNLLELPSDEELGDTEVYV